MMSQFIFNKKEKFLSRDQSEILSFLLLLRYYIFDVKILYTNRVGWKEHVCIFSDFFINFVSSCAR
jgi:hypothetical protein